MKNRTWKRVWITDMFTYTLFHPERARKIILNKKEKNRKKKEKRNPLFIPARAMCNSMALVFLLSFPWKSKQEKQAKSEEKEPKKSKRHSPKAWFYGKYLVFRTFLICFSALCSGPRYRCGAETFLLIFSGSYRRRAGDGSHLSALEATGKRREKAG